MRASYFLWAVVILVCLNPCDITRADPIQIQPQRSEGGGGTETKCVVKLRVVDGNVVDVSVVSGPAAFTAAVKHWVKDQFKFPRGLNGTYTMPIMFVPHQPVKP
jgi:hypothetical protein